MPLIATRGAASAQGFGEFAQTAAPVYIEDVFSTYLINGTTGSQTITNGIDLSAKGGMLWLKSRNGVDNNYLFDSSRGSSKYLISNDTAAQGTNANFVSSFNTNGFTLGTSGYASGTTAVSWTFREQPKFFDIVTYTGNNAARTIAHNLGSVPGCIIIKCLNDTFDWIVWHRSLAAGNYNVFLNTTNAQAPYGVTSSTLPTATEFSLIAEPYTNGNGNTYVAYLFAHNAGGFGLTGSDNVISCGSYTGSGGTTTPNQINLGYEAQWVLVKPSSGVGNWAIADMMRGSWIASDGSANFNELLPNTSGAENANNYGPAPTATGFAVSGVGFPNASGVTYIYIAIRRGPMKTPTTGTSVFTPVAYSGNNNTRTLATGITTDLAITGDRNSGGAYAKFLATSRLQGNGYLVTSDTSAEATDATIYPVDTFTSAQTGVKIGTANPINSSSYTFINWSFRRAPGFFDVVCYTGTGANRTVNHNLGVAPELLITKGRTSVGSSLLWLVYSNSLGNNKYLRLNTTAGSLNDPSGVLWNLTTPTSSVFSLGTGATNESGANYVAYLFASVAGVSKVGSYTGTGTTLQVNCGFTNGSRFVLIKRTDTTGDWWVYDSARGIVAGNDPYLFLNTTDAEVTNTDYVDTFSSGFELSSTAPAGLNANGGTYIFLAIA